MLKEQLGSGDLVKLLRELGSSLAKDYAYRLEGKTREAQIEPVTEIMQEVGYQARTSADGNRGLPLIDARNRIYYHLAREHREVCELDLALLSSLLDTDIEHVECMVRGGRACKFRVLNDKARL